MWKTVGWILINVCLFFLYVHRFKLPINCTCIDAFVALAVDSLTVNMLAFFPHFGDEVEGENVWWCFRISFHRELLPKPWTVAIHSNYDSKGRARGLEVHFHLCLVFLFTMHAYMYTTISFAQPRRYQTLVNSVPRLTAFAGWNKMDEPLIHIRRDASLLRGPTFCGRTSISLLNKLFHLRSFSFAQW